MPKKESMHTDRCGNTSGQKYHARRSRKDTKCKNLCTEIQRIWDLKCMNIPVLI